jgi:ubiquinone/menaquinone biosynthesis C-methylase UbiE
VACGTGIVARLAAERIGQGGLVVGLDISPGMLTVARTQPAPQGARVNWHVGTATALPYRDTSFDAAACQFGLMFVPDRTRAVAELRRVLVPGGRLAVSVWGTEAENPVDARIIAVQARFVGSGASARQSVAHSMGDPDELRRRLSGAGFESVEIETVSHEYRLTLEQLLLRVLAREADEATRDAVRRDLQVALAPYVDGDQIRCPVLGHLATALA